MKKITIKELSEETKEFLKMPSGVAKNLLYQRSFQGNHQTVADILIRDDGTIHFGHTTYLIKKGKSYFLKAHDRCGFTVDPKGKMKIWYGHKLMSLPYLDEVFVKLDKEWVKHNYLPFMTNSIMGKVIIGKITNPHDLFKRILKMYRVKDAPITKLRHAVENNKINKFQLLQGISIAKNLSHYIDFITSKFSVDNIINDLIQQALLLERKIDFTWSKIRMATEHKKWTKELMDIESDSLSKDPLVWLNKFEYHHIPTQYNFKLIDTEYELFREGKIMKHCVFTNYWDKIRKENYVVFHVADGSEYGYTLGLMYGQIRGFVIDQIMGRFNTPAPVQIIEEVNLWVENINKEITPKQQSYLLHSYQ